MVSKRKARNGMSTANYLGIHQQTLRELTDLGQIPAKRDGKPASLLP